MKKSVFRIVLVVAWIAIWGIPGQACRFTVREIGFSTLSREVYTLAFIDGSSAVDAASLEPYRQQLRQSNMQLLVLHPQQDAKHPAVLLASQKGVSFPAVVLISPDQRIWAFQTNNPADIFSEIIDSPVRKKMRDLFYNTFAVVLWVEGKDSLQNQTAARLVRAACESIQNVMPVMPKKVKYPPVAIHISSEKFQNEKLLMWSLGLDGPANEPLAFVMYGRGRKMGAPLNYGQMQDSGLYKYMAMIGADCECSLDRKWMLGGQVPLWWPSETSQLLTDEVGFDVDNPMILAEMSRIMASKKSETTDELVGFVPETIDLSIFDQPAAPDTLTIPEPTQPEATSLLLIYALLFGFVILSVGAFIFFRKK